VKQGKKKVPRAGRFKNDETGKPDLPKRQEELRRGSDGKKKGKSIIFHIGRPENNRNARE